MAEGTEKAALKAALVNQAAEEWLTFWVSAKICEAKGGAWSHEKSCEEYMRSSKVKRVILLTLSLVLVKKFGDKYLPCSPYQALALANVYKVDDHSYFWLWPGGRKEQVKQAALKQEMGITRLVVWTCERQRRLLS